MSDPATSKIRVRRESLGMTQASLADRIGVTKGAISKWETGRGFPRRVQAEALVKVLKLTFNDLYANKSQVA